MLINRRRVQRGIASIGIVMMGIGLAVVMAFMLTSMGMFQLSMAQTSFNSIRARNLAESAIALGEQAMEADITANKPGLLTSPSPATFIVPQVPPGCFGGVSFDPANAQQLPWSTNNLSGTASTTGANGQTVPPGCVQFIGVGRSGAAVIRISVIVYTPAYPFVVACSGAFAADHVTIARATGLPTVAPSVAPSVCPSQYVPGDVVGNTPSNPSLTLKSTLITGNAEANGGVCIDACSKVLGAVQVGVPPAVLPSVNPSVNPIGGFAGLQSFPGSAGCVTVSGLLSTCSSTRVGGNLNLNGAVVYVKGDLTVNGALQGTGALYTSGKLTVNGGANLTSDDVIALVSGGNITLNASCGQQANFVGLIYTGGNLVTNNFHMYGNFVANGHGQCTGCCNPPTGNISLHNTTMVGLENLTGQTLAAPNFSSGTQVCGNNSCFTLLQCPLHRTKSCHCRVCGYIGGQAPGNLPPCYNETSYRFKLQPCGSVCMVSWKSACPCSTTTTNFVGCKCCPRLCSTTRAMECILTHYNPPCCPSLKSFFFGSTCPMLHGKGYRCTIWCCPQITVTKTPLIRLPCTARGQPDVVYTFNFNQFVAPADQARVLLWMQY